MITFSTLCLNRRLPALWALAAMCAVSAISSGAALAQPAAATHTSSTEPRLASRLVLARVVSDAGHEKLTAAAAVQPGDVLQYTAHFGNPTAAAMRDVVATMPVPAGTQWLPKSDQPSGALASVDGVVFAPMPLMRKLLLPSGQWKQVVVPLAEIRYLRWPARPLAASESFSTQLRVLVFSSDNVNASLASSPTSASAVTPANSDPGHTQLAIR
jgi:uncharacterized repeat protein (TIGR01451 family)